MIKLIIAVAFWTFLSWVALRFLNRVGRLTRRQGPNSVHEPQDPVKQAKKADIIDIE